MFCRCSSRDFIAKSIYGLFFLMLLSTELGIPFMNYKLSFSSVTIQNRCNMSATKPINESALILHDSALGSNIWLHDNSKYSVTLWIFFFWLPIYYVKNPWFGVEFNVYNFEIVLLSILKKSMTHYEVERNEQLHPSFDLVYCRWLFWNTKQRWQLPLWRSFAVGQCKKSNKIYVKFCVYLTSRSVEWQLMLFGIWCLFVNEPASVINFMVEQIDEIID